MRKTTIDQIPKIDARRIARRFSRGDDDERKVIRVKLDPNPEILSIGDELSRTFEVVVLSSNSDSGLEEWELVEVLELTLTLTMSF